MPLVYELWLAGTPTTGRLGGLRCAGEQLGTPDDVGHERGVAELSHVPSAVRQPDRAADGG